MFKASSEPKEDGLYREPDFMLGAKSVYLRPGAIECVRWAAEKMDVVLWSDGPRSDAKSLCSKIFTSSQASVLALGSEDTKQGIKMLEDVAEQLKRDVSMFFLVDNEEAFDLLPYPRPRQVIPLPPYYGLPMDGILEELTGFMSAGILTCSNMDEVPHAAWPYALEAALTEPSSNKDPSIDRKLAIEHGVVKNEQNERGNTEDDSSTCRDDEERSLLVGIEDVDLTGKDDDRVTGEKVKPDSVPAEELLGSSESDLC